MRTCEASGCGRTAAGYSRYCALHKATLRRHGAIDQRGLTKADLNPYVAHVRGRIAANQESSAWAKLDARWKTLVRHALGILAEYQGGRATYRYTVKAAEEIVRLDGGVEAREIVITAAAVFLMDQMEPHRFRGDRAFRTQLVRRVRALTEANATSYRNPITGKSRRTYQELSPRATEVMAEWLTEALGILGVHLARLERKEREDRDRERQGLNDDLMALK